MAYMTNRTRAVVFVVLVTPLLALTVGCGFIAPSETKASFRTPAVSTKSPAPRVTPGEQTKAPAPRVTPPTRSRSPW